MVQKKDKKSSLDNPLYKDARGEIRRNNINGTKFNVITTKAGAYRSGDYHKATQYDLILKGKFEVTLRQANKDVVMIKGPNELIMISPNTPHLFKSLTDTVMIEWWDKEFDVGYYQPYRKFVEEQFKKKKIMR